MTDPGSILPPALSFFIEFACLMTRVQALECTRDRLNSTTMRMAKLSSSVVELDGMEEVGYYILVHFLMLSSVKVLLNPYTQVKVLSMVFQIKMYFSHIMANDHG